MINLFADGGDVVINGQPKYNLTNPIIVHQVTQKIVKGIVSLEFVNPINNHTIEVPYFGGDVYVDPSTQQAFIIYVDKSKRTICVFKGYYRLVTPKEPVSHNDTLIYGYYSHFFFINPQDMDWC